MEQVERFSALTYVANNVILHLTAISCFSYSKITLFLIFCNPFDSLNTSYNCFPFMMNQFVYSSLDGNIPKMVLLGLPAAKRNV